MSKESRSDGETRLPVKRTRLTKSHMVPGVDGKMKAAPTGIPRVKVLARFETFQEASDYLRFIKLPKEMRDPKRVELYQSSAWRKDHAPLNDGGDSEG